METWIVIGGAALLALAAPGGPLQRNKDGVSPLQQSVAVLMLLAYVGGSVYAAHNWSIPAAMAATGILTV